ncbi:membrane-associated guanylate kinase, WW and PDZ domain-containing protein 3-like [Mustelus asterias]
MFRKLLSITHWTQRTRETTLCRDEQGVLNLRLLGGAEYGQFLYIADRQGGKGRHLTGKLQAGDLLLEVNETPVSGLTLRDTLGLLANIPDPVHIKTAPQGSQLNADLRHYLRLVFTKGSADFELQDRIRLNLYIRVVPCTTRAPRDGEVPGVDYHFISLSEFQALERAGGLLESGKFEGNYYGTPVPPILPTDGTLILEPSMLRHASRSKSFINLEKRPGRDEGPGSRAGELQETSTHPGSTAATSNGHVTGLSTNQSAAPTGNGVTEQMEGSEERDITTNTMNGTKANSSTRETLCNDHENKQYLSNRGNDSLLLPDVSLMLGHSVFTTVTKTNNTFGFTIAGGNRPTELLQIVSVVVGGPADRSGDVQVHDVIVAIDKISVLGYTHGQVVHVFQAIPEGTGAELHLRRGYQPLYNVEPHLLAEVNARATSGPPAPGLAMLPVAVMQSSRGPGFTVTRGTGGYARVTGISDGRLCPDLREGDLVVKVNGQRVRPLSDQKLEEVLQTHTRTGDAILLVQRAVEVPLTGTPHSPNSTKSLADSSAQLQSGTTERGSRDTDGVPAIGVSSGQQDLESPHSQTQEKTISSQKQADVHPQWEEEGSEVLAVSSQNAFGDKASLASAFIPLKTSHPANTNFPERHETSQVGDRRPTLDGRSLLVKDKGGSSSRKPHLGTRECNGTSDSREGERRSQSLSAPRDIPGVSSRPKLSSYQPDQGSEFYTVDLKRSPTGFGFSVRGGCEYDMDLYVLGLIVGGPAMTSGKIRIGDQLVEINGERTLGMSHSRAVQLIKQEHDKIRLVLRCGNGQVPEFGPDVTVVAEPGRVTFFPDHQESMSQIPRGESELYSLETQGSLGPESHYPTAVLSSSEAARSRKRGGLAEVVQSQARGSRASRTRHDCLDSQPNTENCRGGSRLAKRQHVEARPEALPDPGSQALQDHARPQAHLKARPQALLKTGPQALHKTGPQALPTQTGPQNLHNTGPQALPGQTRPHALHKTEPQPLPGKTKPQALPGKTKPQSLRMTGPQALPDLSRLQAFLDTGQQAEESSETDWEDGETDSGNEETDSGDSEASPSQEALSSGSFDEQRQMHSMIGKALDFASRALQPDETAAEKYCAQCGSQSGRGDRRRDRLLGILAPGPWLVPGRGKLQEIIDR